MSDPITAAAVWSVLWVVFTVVSFWVGLVVLVHGSIFGGLFGGKNVVKVTVPAGILILAFCVFSLIRAVIQIIDAIQLAVA